MRVVWRGGGGGAFGLRASHGWSVGVVARRVPEARVVGGAASAAADGGAASARARGCAGERVRGALVGVARKSATD
eukprot:COSAG02_NODE_45224_length_359_cov_0.742308_1_plen_75_part_01